MRKLALAALVATAMSLTACLHLPLGFSITHKTVVAKSGKNLLHASDGSTCRVSEKTFNLTRARDIKTCAWAPADRGPGIPAWAQAPGALVTRAPVLRPRPPRQ